MELFKLVGKIAIDGVDQAQKDIEGVGKSAKSTASTIDSSNKSISSSNQSTGSSWSNLKSSVEQYKAQGMSTSQAWRQATQDMKASATDAGNGTVGAFAKIGAAIATYLVVDKIIAFGQGCLQAAADAQAMESQFSQVFGNLESKASKSLNNIANTTGVNENRMKGSFTKIAAFAKTSGMDTKDALSLSERAMMAVADSAAFYDRSLEETTESLQSFLKGNYENDAALGLSATETTRNAAANKLYGKSFNELSEEQKQLTLLQMVEDANKASGALGQAARESDTWTNVLGNLKQGWTDFQAILGAAVLPTAVQIVKRMASALEGLAEKTKDAIQWAKEHEGIMTVIGIAFATVGAAILGYNIYVNAATIATKLYSAATTIATTATSIFGSVIAFLTSPVTLVVLAIGALVAAVVVMYKKFDWFKNIVDTIKEKLIDFGQNALEKIKEKMGEVKEFFQQVGDKAKELWQNLEPLRNLIADNLVAAFQNMKEPLQSIWDSFRMVGDVIKNDLLPALRDSLMPLWEQLKPVLMAVAAILGGTLAIVFAQMVGFINGVVQALSGLVQAFSGIVQIVSNVFKLIVGVITGDGEMIKEAVQGIKDGIVKVFGGLWDAVKGFVTGFVDGVVGFFKGLWDTLVGHSIVPDIIDGIVGCFSDLWGKVKGLVSNFKDGVINVFNTVKDKVSDTFNNMKNKVTNTVTGLKDKAVSTFNNMKDKASTAFSNMKSKVTDTVSGLASSAGEKFNSIKEKISSAVSSAKEKASSVFSDMKSSISTHVGGALSTVTDKFNSIKSKISNVMDSAKEKVTSGVKKLKSAFDFKWSLPKIKMPHFKVSGGKAPWGFGGKGSLPKVSVSWYKKAYDEAMILNSPTVFGYSAASGKFLGGGDGNGNEVVAGEGRLMQLISAAVAEQNEAVAYYLQKIIAVLADFFPQIIEEMGRPVCWNPDEAAAAMAVPMDKYLGRIQQRKDRGR